MANYSKCAKLFRFLSLLTLLIAAGEAFAAPLINSVQRYKVHQPSYGFDFDIYRTNDTPDTWFRTYDGFFVTRRPDKNWVYGKISGSEMVNTNILVGSVNPAAVRELEPSSQSQIIIRPGTKPGEPSRIYNFDSPEPEFVQKRAWDEIPWAIPPEDKVNFAERIYTTLKNAMSSRRDAYMLYGEPLHMRSDWQPSSLFTEVPFPGDWGQSIAWANDKRGILWWTKWHIFGISTYGSKVLGAWILDSGYGYNTHKIPMAHFWKWYDARIKLFSHFFQKEPIHDDEMAVWLLNEKYLFILVPHIGMRVENVGDFKLLKFLNPLEWVLKPLRLLDWIGWAFGWRPTDKQMLYYLVRLSEVPDEVTLNQTIRALRDPAIPYPGYAVPMKPEDIHEARDVENMEAAEKAQMRRKRQRQEQQE